MNLSGKYWYQCCRDWLKGVGFVECPTCLVLFSSSEKDGSQLWLILYVDDFLYFCTNEKMCKKFELEFGSIFHIEFQGKANWYLAARIDQDKYFHITIDQSRYAKSIVRCYLDPAGVNKTTKIVHKYLTSIICPHQS